MGRRIVTSQLQSAGNDRVDSYAARVVKFIPADVVAAWIALTALLPAPGPASRPAGAGPSAGQTDIPIQVHWIVFAAVLVLTPLWTWRVTRESDRPPAWTQATMATAAFAVWVFATGGPFEHYAFYNPAYGGIALILFTLASGLLDPEQIDRRITGTQPPG